MFAAQIGNGNASFMLLQNADDLLFGESGLLYLWSFRSGQSLSRTGLNLGGDVRKGSSKIGFRDVGDNESAREDCHPGQIIRYSRGGSTGAALSNEKYTWIERLLSGWLPLAGFRRGGFHELDSLDTAKESSAPRS